ncbi:MAG TPA: hypothetical protein VG710_06805 [Opitutus sp.]|nr:hypothetical protein [Opitutus sp.]
MNFFPLLHPPALGSSALLAFGLVAASQVASAQTVVVLDDFSTNLLGTDYVQKTVDPFGAGGWFISGGELQPDTVSAPVNDYGAWVWTANSLQNAGDWFSVDIDVSGTGGDHNGGLSIWSGNTTTFDRVLEPRLSYNSDYAYLASDQNGNVWSESLTAGVINGPVTLKVTLTGRSGSNTNLQFDLSDSDGAIGPAEFYTVSGYTGPLYVGPSAWQATGGNVAFDNLAYSTTSAVPEPSTCAALAGVVAFAMAGVQRKRRKRRGGP